MKIELTHLSFSLSRFLSRFSAWILDLQGSQMLSFEGLPQIMQTSFARGFSCFTMPPHIGPVPKQGEV